MTSDPTEGGKLCGCRKTDGSGNHCRHPAGWGVPGITAGPCKFHGGATPTVRRGSEKLMAAQAVATYGLPRDIDPHEALLEEVHRTAGHVAYLGRIVADLDQKDLKQYGAGSPPGSDEFVVWEKPAVWVELYQAERKHLVAVCKTAVGCGIDERRLELAEQQGRILADVMRAIFDDPELGLSKEQRVSAPALVRKHLALIAA